MTALLISAVLMLGLFTGCSTVSEPPYVSAAAEPYEPLVGPFGRLGQTIDTMLIRNDFRGVAFITQNGDTILRAAYGMACDVQNIENTVYSPFHIASVSKHFTGAAILLLEQDGKLDTSDTLDNFFTGHDGLENVTIAHLLAMKGGFYDYSHWLLGLVEAGEFVKVLSISAEDIEAHIISNWSGAPQDEPTYCNSDYWLLGRIIEQVSGMAYDEFVVNRLFTPAGVTNSGFSGIHESVSPHGILGVYFDGQNLMDATNWPFIISYSTGGLISTVDDLNLWLDAYFGGKLFPQYLLDDILVGRYNYGWAFVSDSIWHHPGNMPGFNAHIAYDRDNGSRIILLSNYDRGIPWNLIRPISRMVLGTEVAGIGILIGH